VDIAEVQARIREFVAERDWERFHTPKNVAAALSVEAAELLEIFTWLTPEESSELAPPERQHAAEEVADVLVYSLRLADLLGIDVDEAVDAKLRANAVRYPAEAVRGSLDRFRQTPAGGREAGGR
jgi:dCTP diphosphatase